MSIPPPPPFGSNQPSDSGSNPPPYGQPSSPPGYPQPGYPQPGFPPAPTYGQQPPTYGQPHVPPGYQAYQGGMGGPVTYAGFGARLGALLIDSLISLLFSLPAIISFFAGPSELQECEVDGDPALCDLPTSTGWAIFGVLLAVGVISYWIIHCRMLGKGQSWGMKVVNTRLVGAQDGQPIGAGRAFGRQLFAQFISGSVCLLGYLWGLWDGKKQTWHDKVVGSVVVKS